MYRIMQRMLLKKTGIHENDEDVFISYKFA